MIKISGKSFRSKLTKGTAVFVCTAFLATSVYLPQAKAEVSPVLVAGYRSLADDLTAIALPKEIGKIQETYRGTSDKIVVLIQDAHSIPDAQRSIRSAIDHFQTQYGVSLVGLEGASEKLDPQLFRSFPDKELLRKTFDAYAQRGELTGGTAAALFNTSPSNYHGIEDWPLYEEGVSYFLKSTAIESEIKTLLEPMVAALNREKETVYSKKLLEIDRLLANFGENKTDLAQCLNQLSKYQPPPKGSELAVLIKEIQRDQITDTPIEIEIKKIAEQVASALKSQPLSTEIRQELLEFNGKLQEFRTARTTPQAFALYLKGLVQKHKIRVKVSRKLAYLVENQKRLKDIEGTRLFEEFKHYADSVKGSLFQNDHQKTLDIQTRGLELIKRLTRLELSFEDWGKVQKMISQLDRWTVTQDGVVSRDEVSALLRKMEPHLAFYRVAEKRDQVFLKNIQSMMGQQDKTSSLLVAGGFHTEGLTQTFKANGISYVLVMPNIGSIPEEPLYREHMQGQVSWSSYFEVKDGKVNLYDAFVRAARDKLLGDKTATAIGGKEWRDQIIRDLSAEGRITQASAYTRFIDETAQVSSPSNQSLQEKWLANIDRFGEGLKKLQTEGNLSESSILQLIKTITIPEISLANQLTPNGQAEVRLLPSIQRPEPAKESSKARAENRAVKLESLGSIGMNPEPIVRSDPAYGMLLAVQSVFQKALATLVLKVSESNKTTTEYGLGFETTNQHSTFNIGLWQGSERKMEDMGWLAASGGYLIHIHPWLKGEGIRSGTGEVVPILRGLSEILSPSRKDVQNALGDAVSGAILAGSQTSGYFMLAYDLENPENVKAYETHRKDRNQKQEAVSIEYLLEKKWARLFQVDMDGAGAKLREINFKSFMDSMKELRAKRSDLFSELELTPPTAETRNSSSVESEVIGDALRRGLDKRGLDIPFVVDSTRKLPSSTLEVEKLAPTSTAKLVPATPEASARVERRSESRAGEQPIISSLEDVGRTLGDVNKMPAAPALARIKAAKLFLDNVGNLNSADEQERRSLIDGISAAQEALEKDVELQEIASRAGRNFFDVNGWLADDFGDDGWGHVTTGEILVKVAVEGEGFLDPEFNLDGQGIFVNPGPGQAARIRLHNKAGMAPLVLSKERLDQLGIPVLRGAEGVIKDKVPLGALTVAAKLRAIDVILNELNYSGRPITDEVIRKVAKNLGVNESQVRERIHPTRSETRASPNPTPSAPTLSEAEKQVIRMFKRQNESIKVATEDKTQKKMALLFSIQSALRQNDFSLTLQNELKQIISNLCVDLGLPEALRNQDLSTQDADKHPVKFSISYEREMNTRIKILLEVGSADQPSYRSIIFSYDLDTSRLILKFTNNVANTLLADAIEQVLLNSKMLTPESRERLQKIRAFLLGIENRVFHVSGVDHSQIKDGDDWIIFPGVANAFGEGVYASEQPILRYHGGEGLGLALEDIMRRNLVAAYFAHLSVYCIHFSDHFGRDYQKTNKLHSN